MCRNIVTLSVCDCALKVKRSLDYLVVGLLTEATSQQESDMEDVSIEIAEGLCFLEDKVCGGDTVKLWEDCGD